MQAIIHYFLHFGAPLLIAYFFFKTTWKKTYLIFVLSMLVDLDHLLANPIFDPNRCSINFHPLHTYYAILIYALLLIPKKTRVIAFALLFHMLTDWIDFHAKLIF
ncbi:MAG: hypothetical protein HRT69_01930 [Flavobacteriaceae bacterium]|nr:hypothetical protein [Flavobacteriaceae bacterium]